MTISAAGQWTAAACTMYVCMYWACTHMHAQAVLTQQQTSGRAAMQCRGAKTMSRSPDEEGDRCRWCRGGTSSTAGVGSAALCGCHVGSHPVCLPWRQSCCDVKSQTRSANSVGRGKQGNRARVSCGNLMAGRVHGTSDDDSPTPPGRARPNGQWQRCLDVMLAEPSTVLYAQYSTNPPPSAVCGRFIRTR